jgi:hypothetical protein
VPALPGFIHLRRKGVSRGPHSDDGLARVHIVGDVLHLIVRQIAEASEEHERIGGRQRLKARYVVADVRIHHARSGVGGEQNRAPEAMVRAEDPRELWESLLGAVFFVSADKDNMFASARTSFSLEDHTCRSQVESAEKRQYACQSHGFDLIASTELRSGSSGRIRVFRA